MKISVDFSRLDTIKDAKIYRRRAYGFDSRAARQESESNTPTGAFYGRVQQERLIPGNKRESSEHAARAPKIGALRVIRVLREQIFADAREILAVICGYDKGIPRCGCGYLPLKTEFGSFPLA